MPLTVTLTAASSAHAGDALVEGGGQAAGADHDHAALAGERLGVLDVLDVDRDVVALGDGAVGVIEGGVVAEQHLDLGVDLALGDLRGGHLDLHRVVGGELAARAELELDGVDEVLVVGDGVLELPVLAGLHRDDVELVDDLRLGLADEVVGGLREHGAGAEHVVDDGTRGVTSAEAREAILFGSVAVGLLDGSVDVGGRDGDRRGELCVLHVRSDVQRSSSYLVRHG